MSKTALSNAKSIIHAYKGRGRNHLSVKADLNDVQKKSQEANINHSFLNGMGECLAIHFTLYYRDEYGVLNFRS